MDTFRAIGSKIVVAPIQYLQAYVDFNAKKNKQFFPKCTISFGIGWIVSVLLKKGNSVNGLNNMTKEDFSPETQLRAIGLKIL